MADYPDRVHIDLYHTPQLTKFIKAIVPRRMQEGLGVWHTKIYGFDDDVIMSGCVVGCRAWLTSQRQSFARLLHEQARPLHGHRGA